MRNTQDVIDLRGTLYYLKDKDVDRLLSKIDKTPDGCWQWNAYTNNCGYGRFNLGGQMMFAHRVAYLMFTGPIPTGLELDHLCRNRACVNPDHLEAVTHKENLNRSPIAPGVVNARKTHCKHNHEFTPDNTYIQIKKDGKTIRQCKKCVVNRVSAHRKAKKAGTK